MKWSITMHSRTNSGESNRIHQPTIAELPLGMQSITRAAAFGTSTENNTGPTNSHVTSAANAKKNVSAFEFGLNLSADGTTAKE